MRTSAVSHRRSARRAVKRLKMSSNGYVVGSIIAESISTQPLTTSDPVSANVEDDRRARSTFTTSPTSAANRRGLPSLPVKRARANDGEPKALGEPSA